MKIQQFIKPLSVNQAWQGKRYKTNAYICYERQLLLQLPKLKLPEPPYEVKFEFGFSNKGSDIDNALKPLIDVMQKKYEFNDRDIYRLIVNKVIVKKGLEYFRVEMSNFKIQ